MLQGHVRDNYVCSQQWLKKKTAAWKDLKALIQHMKKVSYLTAVWVYLDGMADIYIYNYWDMHYSLLILVHFKALIYTV